MLNKKEYLKNYQNINKIEIAKKRKIYRLLNKDYILDYKKIKIKCSCGCNIRKGDLYKHLRTKKHLKNINKLVDQFFI